MSGSMVVYRCNTCDREKTFPRNERGLEHIGKCNITLGCRGKLLQERMISGYSRGTSRDRVIGLNNWYPRKILHEHDQSIASNEWRIHHNFGTNPAIVVFADDETLPSKKREIIPDDVVIHDPDSLSLHFNKSYSGTAQLIARQSDPDLFKPIEEESEIEEEVYRITYDNQITIATRISSLGDANNFRLVMSYNRDGIAEYRVTYVVDSSVDQRSPWSNYDKVVIKGKIYRVRSFDFTDIEMASGGKIQPGTNVSFSIIDNGDGAFRDIEKNEVIVLLANEPYKSVDKNTRQYIDAYDTRVDKTSIVYNEGIMFAIPSVVKNIFPPIKSVSN